jgi:hypothetical protein
MGSQASRQIPPQACRLAALAIGAAAHEALVEGTEAQILGVTSRGLFLSCPPERVVFLSYETYKGPLTVNIFNAGDIGPGLRSGAPVQIRSRTLFFPSTGQVLSLQGAPLWRAAPPAGERLAMAGLFERTAGLIERVLAGKEAEDYPSFLREVQALLFRRRLPESAGGGQQSEGWESEGRLRGEAQLRVDLLTLHEALALFFQPGAGPEASRRITGLTGAIETFLGRGQGLTPAGDDLVLGLALAANRWPALSRTAQEGEMLSASLEAWLPALARQKTTLLSANLISCACAGQADERLIWALDGLLTGEPGLEECAKHLLAWGSSSGSEALAGMALAVSACAGFSPMATNDGSG